MIWLPSICKNQHTIFGKVLNNSLMKKVWSLYLEDFLRKSFLTHIDWSQIEKWPQNEWRWNFSSLVSIEKLQVMLKTIWIWNFSQKLSRVLEKMPKNLIFGQKRAQKKIWWFLSANRALSLLFSYDALTSCQKAKKSLEPLLRKVHIN